MTPEPPEPEEEYELALRAREGDREALAELVERTRLGLFQMAYAELRRYDDAHDAVAGTLLQVCLHVGSLREPQRMRAWMRGILRNEVRRLRRRPPEVSLEEGDAQPDTAAASLLRLDVQHSLRQLSSEQARVVRLFYLEDLPIAEIARRMEHPTGTVRSWLCRGRRHLAREMKGYAPMAPTAAPAAAAPAAALVHTGLEPALVSTVSAALEKGGYGVRVITPTDLGALLSALREVHAVILDEQLAGHSAFELLMHMKSDPAFHQRPVCVLAADPSAFTATAYFSAGVDRLVNKRDPEAVASLSLPQEKRPDSPWRRTGWQRFTKRARRIVFYAQEEAARLGTPHVDTEHLLLGLVRESDSLAGRILERLGIPCERVREEVARHAARAEGRLGQDMQLAARAQHAVNLAEEEAQSMGHNYLGSEHLLLGLLAEGQGLAAQVLTGLGLTLDRVREAVRASGAG